MKPVFADTSYFLALFSEEDVHHSKAVLVSREQSRPMVLTEFVLLELGNSLCRGHARRVFVDLVAHLRSDPLYTVVPVSESLFESGLNLFAQRPDKEWSLTDCISFIVMQRLHLTEALTADHHFEQAGFKALLR
jgi:uncharacterized protein